MKHLNDNLPNYAFMSTNVNSITGSLSPQLNNVHAKSSQA